MKKISSKWIKIASLIALPTLTVAAISPVTVSCSSDNDGGSKNQFAKDKWIIKDYCKYNPSAKVKSVISQQQYDSMVNGDSWANGNKLLNLFCITNHGNGPVDLTQKISYALRFIFVDNNTIVIGNEHATEYHYSTTNATKIIWYTVDVYKFDESTQSWTYNTTNIKNAKDALGNVINEISENFKDWARKLNASSFEEQWLDGGENELISRINHLSYDIETAMPILSKRFKQENGDSARITSSNLNFDWDKFSNKN